MLDLFLDFLEAPERAARHVVEARPVRAGVLAFAVGGASLLASVGAFAPLPTLRALPWAAGLWAGWELAAGLLTASVVDFMLSDGGRRGTCLFVLLGLSELAWAVFLPVGLLVLAARLGLPGWLFAFSVFFAASLWLKVRSVRDVYGVPPLKAAAALGGAYALFGAALAAGAVVCLWGFGSLAAGLFS